MGRWYTLQGTVRGFGLRTISKVEAEYDTKKPRERAS